MKKLFLTVLFTSLFLFSGVVFAKTSVKNPWQKLKAKGIKTLRVRPVVKTNTLKINMRGIKNALQRAGISEPVKIFLFFGNKNLGSLGSYTPSVKDDGNHGQAKDDGQHGDGKFLTPVFKSIPAVKSLKMTKGQFPKGNGIGLLIFKNSQGQEMARLPVNLVGMTGLWKVQTARPR